jgi:metallo-beta-lactamase family protein
MFLIEVNNKKILLECGLFQGRRHEMYERNKNFDFNPEEIDVLIASHAHIDHIGNIPNLVRCGFKGKIYTTQVTRELCEILLQDSAYIQENEIEFVNRIRKKQKLPFIEPLYYTKDVERSLDLFEIVELNKRQNITKHISFMLRDAGHILGSSSVLFEIRERGKFFRFGFTGDIGRKNMAITHDPDELRDLDVLLMESTYGKRCHSKVDDSEEEVAKIINETYERGGKIIIPCFAVGRTQDIVYVIHKLFNQNRIPDIPVFVDSPLAVKATEIFKKHSELYDRESSRIFLDDSIDNDPFGFSRLKYITSVEDSKSLGSIKYLHIIISASGMCEGGRILHHLKNNISYNKNTLLFVGYAAKNTLARKIISGDKKVKIFGEEYKVKCKIKVMDSFSAHADRRELLDYVKYCSPKRLKKIFLVHGEPSESQTLIDAFRSKGYQNVYYPKKGETFKI